MLETMTDAPAIATGPTIYVCTTCRPPGEPDSAVRPGAILASATVAAAAVFPCLTPFTAPFSRPPYG